MSASIVKLPPFAAVKWGTIYDAGLQAQNAIQSTLSRIRELEDQLGMLDGSPECGGIEMEIGRLRAVMASLQTRHVALTAVLGTLRLYREKMAGHELEDAPPVTPRLKANEPLADTVKRIRAEIAQLAAEKSAVANALLPLAAQKEAASAWVNELVKSVNIRIKTEPFEAVFETNSGGFSIARWLAWFAPEALKARLHDELENQLSENALVLTGPERKTRLSEIKSRLDRLGREEEALIMRAQEAGTEILRRPDADPACVLGVRRKTAKAAAA